MSFKKIKINFFPYRIITFIYCIFILSACAETNSLIQFYEGPKKLDNEVTKLLIPNEIEVIEIDSSVFKTPFTASGVYQIELLPGDHEFTVIYKAFWGVATDGGMVSSKVFLFKPILAAGEMFFLKHNAPEDLVNANFDMIGSDINIWLYRQSTDQIIKASKSIEAGGLLNLSTNKIVTKDPSLSSKSFQPQNPYEELKKAWLNADDRQRALFKTWVVSRSLGAKQATKTGATNETKNSDADKSKEKHTEQQLEHGWKMADDKQRKAFNDWLVKRSLDGKGLY